MVCRSKPPGITARCRVTAAGDLFAVVIAVALAFKRQPERADVQFATGGRIGRDYRHHRQELDGYVASSLRYVVDYPDLAGAGHPVLALPRSHQVRTTMQKRDETRLRATPRSPRHYAGPRMNRPPPHVHGKEGSTVRVRQRVLQKPCRSEAFSLLVLQSHQRAPGMEPIMELPGWRAPPFIACPHRLDGPRRTASEDRPVASKVSDKMRLVW